MRPLSIPRRRVADPIRKSKEPARGRSYEKRTRANDRMVAKHYCRVQHAAPGASAAI